jgi:hypothetical protein
VGRAVSPCPASVRALRFLRGSLAHPKYFYGDFGQPPGGNIATLPQRREWVNMFMEFLMNWPTMVFLWVGSAYAAFILVSHLIVLPMNCIAVMKNPDPLEINTEGMTEVHIATLMETVDALQTFLTKLRERQ